ncbi:hypothetical protein [Angelakisella massiliensis]|uniref:hypothetical protein n=1 Tax=Angelakisella massiliensis TaxID=1871018 RepID=UPI0024B278DC|nr:hypothetical protein [Angelakisella massiliensis]
MSKALICDRCKKPFSEQVALSIDTKWSFIHAHYDLCPKCHNDFKIFVGERKETSAEE